uniref:Transport and Golgi organization protein 1 homolog n=1 Tax=Callorhinus ursinus TaxID=34884 RepID=A0A3Q7N0A7_CALUR
SSSSHVLFQLVRVVPDYFPLGPDGVGVLWKLPVITASLGICLFLLYIWRTILAGQDELEDGEQRASRAKKRAMHECEELLEDHYNALSSLKTAQEAELNMLRRKVDIVVDFSNQRQVAAEG